MDYHHLAAMTTLRRPSYRLPLPPFLTLPLSPSLFVSLSFLIEDYGALETLTALRGLRSPPLASLSIPPPLSLSFSPILPCFHVNLGPPWSGTDLYHQLAGTGSSFDFANLKSHQSPHAMWLNGLSYMQHKHLLAYR